jgi:hypothetical protein
MTSAITPTTTWRRSGRNPTRTRDRVDVGRDDEDGAEAPSLAVIDGSPPRYFSIGTSMRLPYSVHEPS